jgi:hypothetical protein
MIGENLTFHVIMDYMQKKFWMDGPGRNGPKLYYEMVKAVRKGKHLRYFGVRALSQDTALLEAKALLADYSYSGSWPSDFVSQHTVA